ncbi:MAG TPA: hypothetical protein VFB27_02080, partial [Opitutaceae bacterium]|nr:hypothetical protein [Opitutaceae bacterium]
RFGQAQRSANKEDIMKETLLISAIALAAALPAQSQTTDRQTKNSPLDGTWELLSGQPLPQGARDIKIIAGGHVIFVAYDSATGKPLYTGGGTFTLKENSYTEHLDFASERISALIGKDQPFTIKMDGDTFTQTGTLSNGKPLAEVWKRID